MNRRAFLAASVATAATAVAGPRILGAADKAGTQKPRLGAGEQTYEVQTHAFGELPAGLEYQTTQAVAFDSEGLVYISNQGIGRVIDTVFVFEPSGKFVRSFGRAFHGGCHGLDIRKEAAGEFCYITNTSVESPKIAKTTLKGETVWVRDRPDAEQYADPKRAYKPTNVAFLPNGEISVCDGYGSNCLIRYDAEGNQKAVTGMTGSGVGQFKTPHGHWVDSRDAAAPQLVVCDRSNRRLQRFTLDGKPVGQSAPGEVLAPCHIDTRGGVMLVPDLSARVSLFGPDNTVLAHLGDDAAWRAQVLAEKNKMRTQPERWLPGKFVHPHDAAFDSAGNIVVAEWVVGGRVSVLKKVG